MADGMEEEEAIEFFYFNQAGAWVGETTPCFITLDPTLAEENKAEEKELSEGDQCPDCDGKMIYPPVENCRCHIAPPCSACVDNELKCESCGFTVEE
jgi:hypothetical protein